MKKLNFLCSIMVLVTVFLTACGTQKSGEIALTDIVEGSQESTAGSEDEVSTESIEIQLFVAASLKGAIEEIITNYEKEHPDVTVTLFADSSGTLMTQIEEGYACDVFFSADTKQINELENEDLLIPDTRVDLLKNQVVLITSKDSNTKVTGFDSMSLASSIALADESVPVGKYARNIMIRLGILPKTDNVSSITTQQIKEALGGIEINECSNVSKVKEAVKEKSNEIGVVYYSDAYSVKEDVTIIATADKALAGEIIYPIAQVKNSEAGEEEVKAASDFIKFLQSDEAKNVFKGYMFLLNE